MHQIDNHTQYNYKSSEIHHDYWNRGDCVACGKVFCVDRVPAQVRFMEKGKVLPPYICSKCNQGYYRK